MRLLRCSGKHEMWAVGRKAADAARPTLGSGDSRWWDPGDCARPRHKPTAAAAANAPDSRMMAGTGFAGVRRGQGKRNLAEDSHSCKGTGGRGVPLARVSTHKHMPKRAQEGPKFFGGAVGGLAPASPDRPSAAHAVGYGDNQGQMGLPLVHICPRLPPPNATLCCSPSCFSQSTWT